MSFHINPPIAETGEITEVLFYSAGKNQVSLLLSLPGNGSCFIVFRSTTAPSLTAVGQSLWRRTKLQRSKAGKQEFNTPGLKDFISSPKNAEVNIWYSKNRAITTTNGEWKWRSGQQTVQLPAPLLLNNPWVLHFENTTRIGRDTMVNLIPLNQSTKDAIKYYSGNVVYTTTFTMTEDHVKINRRLLLDLGRVKEIAEVTVNGKNIGVCWHSPFRVDITDAVKPGENFLLVEVVNTINNRLVGDAKLPEQYRRMKGNITRLPNAWSTPFAEAKLIDAGLIGPVQIHFAQVLGK